MILYNERHKKARVRVGNRPVCRSRSARISAGCGAEEYGEGEASMNIKEVARAAGVSVATISRVLNHPQQVQPETRDHVLAVMRELDYQPNWFARGLNIGKTGTIALLVPNIADRRFVDLITGVEAIARKKEHTVLLCNTYAEAEEELRCLKMVLNRQVDGLILVSSQLDDGAVGPLLKPSFPWVHVGGRAPESCRNLCMINYEKGACQMTAHLLKLGHPEVALLLDRAPLAEMEAITAGYRRARAEGGLAPEGRILRAENSVQGGYLTAQKLFQSGGRPPAMIAAGDQLAFGVTKAAADEQVAIPRDMALACLQDSQVCSILTPALTALELPAHRLGLVAARMLFDCIEGGEDGGPQEIILQPTLKIRGSCGNTSPIYELFG